MPSTPQPVGGTPSASPPVLLGPPSQEAASWARAGPASGVRTVCGPSRGLELGHGEGLSGTESFCCFLQPPGPGQQRGGPRRASGLSRSPLLSSPGPGYRASHTGPSLGANCRRRRPPPPGPLLGSHLLTSWGGPGGKAHGIDDAANDVFLAHSDSLPLIKPCAARGCRSRLAEPGGLGWGCLKPISYKGRLLSGVLD